MLTRNLGQRHLPDAVRSARRNLTSAQRNDRSLEMIKITGVGYHGHKETDAPFSAIS